MLNLIMYYADFTSVTSLPSGIQKENIDIKVILSKCNRSIIILAPFLPEKNFVMISCIELF